jgi:galactokinase
MDQYASACGKKDSVMLLDCKTLKCEYIPCKLGDYSLVIIDCNKPHNLVESKYNERRQQTEQALELLQQKVKADCLADITPEQYKSICGILPPEIEKRARHVIEECARVESAKDKLIGGDIVGLGKILNASHASLRDLYEVTGRELDVLAELAQNHPACVGSRMTGGGFGGCTISLVKSDMVQDFKTQVLTEYRKATGYKAMCYDAQISDGIIVKKLL